MTQLETLSNELLLDLFDYFDTVSLISIFFGLNTRFNRLIRHYLRCHTLDLRFISKDKFDHLCKHVLPFLVDQVTSLCISTDETPDLPSLLFSRHFLLDRFVHLQSLTLWHFDSMITLIQIISQCQSIDGLTRLSIIQEDGHRSQEQIDHLLHHIWNLTKLTYCNLNSITALEFSPCQISQISTSMRTLLIEGMTCHPHTLPDLLRWTPHLTMLSIKIYSYADEKLLQFSMPSITALNLTFGGSCQSLATICQLFPNVNQLRLKISKSFFDGNEWERLIIEHLPRLTRFHFIMRFTLEESDENMDIAIDDVLQTFRSHFWLQERQWFVRCHWNPSDPYRWVTLYTLPYAFDTFDYSSHLRSKSTCDEEDETAWLNKPIRSVKNVCLGNRLVPEEFRTLPNCFNHIDRLDIDILSDHRWMFSIRLFENLVSLSIRMQGEMGFDSLQVLLDHAPHLYSLKVQSYIGLGYAFFDLRSRSIRCLDLTGIRFFYTMHCPEYKCQRLVRSPLGEQCEVLRIGVQRHQSILDFIRRMPNLRSLIVQCQEDQSFLRYFSFSSPNLLTWLRNHLLPTDVIVSDSTSQGLFSFRIWLDREARKTPRIPSNKRYTYKVSDYLKLFQ